MVRRQTHTRGPHGEREHRPRAHFERNGRQTQLRPSGSQAERREAQEGRAAFTAQQSRQGAWRPVRLSRLLLRHVHLRP
eukprot:4003595-Pyramimonas_sp.AAC.1